MRIRVQDEWRQVLGKIDKNEPLDRKEFRLFKEWRSHVRDVQRASGTRALIPRGGFLLRSKRLVKKAGLGVS